VVIGKVESIADKTVKAKNYQPGATDEVEYQVATVKIDDGVLGAKGLTHVQVAWTQNGPIRPGPRGGNFQVSLTKDQEACFFLTKHPTEAFYVVTSTQHVVEKTKPDFDKYSALTKKCAKALDDPQKSLKSKEASERLLTATLLINRYRQAKPGATKQEAIDADESKLIFAAMLEADWTKTDPETGNNPQNMFYMLGLTPQDGWQQPQNVKTNNDIIDAMKKWVKDNADSYRIKKFVAEKTDK